MSDNKKQDIEIATLSNFTLNKKIKNCVPPIKPSKTSETIKNLVENSKNEKKG